MAALPVIFRHCFQSTNKVSASISRATKESKFAERLTSCGADAVGNSPHEFPAMIKLDPRLWSEAFKVAEVSKQ